MHLRFLRRRIRAFSRFRINKKPVLLCASASLFLCGLDCPDPTTPNVIEDPSTPGPYSNIASVEYLNETGIQGMPYDPLGVSGPNYKVDLAWGKIVYPAEGTGSEPEVSSAQNTYPVVIFLHGRHDNCDDNGPRLGGNGSDERPGACLPVGNRIPDFRGYDYILERLASHGMIAVSISAHEIQHDRLGPWNYELRGRLILSWLDILRDWHLNGTDPWDGIFEGKLNFERVGLSGHSRGGEGVVAAEGLSDSWPNEYNIIAINAIAPTDQNASPYSLDDAAYFVIIPARDGDVSNMQGLRTYDRAFPSQTNNPNDKMVAIVHGANHNYFNTTWTDTNALGATNPWASARDDGVWVPARGAYKMSADEQRTMGSASIVAFFRQYILNANSYRELFSGHANAQGVRNDLIFWTFQDNSRAAVDNFEQRPADILRNTLNGRVTPIAFDATSETLFSNSNTRRYSTRAPLPPLPAKDPNFFHDTLGLKLVWSGAAAYVTNFPSGFDASRFQYLSLRAAKDGARVGSSGRPVNLLLNLVDSQGNTAPAAIRTDQFNTIPHPYPRIDDAQSLLAGVQVPLCNFTRSGSSVDLTSLRRIIIRTQGSGEIGIDDIEFSN